MRVFCIISVILFLLSIVGLFKVKLYVQGLHRELIKTKNEICAIETEMKVLQAEWSYLNNPTRLATLAEKYLDSSLTQTEQIKSIDILTNCCKT